MDGACCWVMVYTEERHLAVVAADASDGPARLREQLHSGRNFILIGSRRPDLMDAACTLLRTSPERLPKPLSRNCLFMLGPHVQPRDFDAALEAMERGQTVYFLEHLDLPATQPPKVRRYLVYCDVWGIISQHDELHDAENAWTDYLAAVNAQRPAPEAGIYKWEGDYWRSLETETNLLRQI